MAGNLLNWMRTKAQCVLEETTSLCQSARMCVCVFVVGGVKCAINPELGYSYSNKSDKNTIFSLLIG